MKFTTAIVTVFSLARASDAIYLDCCKTAQECPQYYDNIGFAQGEETLNACCYPSEKPRTEDLPECVHPIMTEDGVGIAVMSLPSTKLEAGNETELLEEITITEGNEEITITAEITTVAESSTTAEETISESKKDYHCCAVPSIVSSLRSTELSACPTDLHSVEGLTLNLALLDSAAKTNMQVCCDAETQASDVDEKHILPCNTEVTTKENDAEDTTDEDQKDDKEESGVTNDANALTTDDESNSANAIKSTAFGIAALWIAVQALL